MHLACLCACMGMCAHERTCLLYSTCMCMLCLNLNMRLCNIVHMQNISFVCMHDCVYVYKVNFCIENGRFKLHSSNLGI